MLIEKISGIKYTRLAYTRKAGIMLTMIKSFADKETEKIYNQTFSKKLPPIHPTDRIEKNDYD